VFIEILVITLHTEVTMSDINTNPLGSFRALNNLSLLDKKSDTTTATSAESLKETFQQMLMISMMSGLSSSGSDEANASSMLMPLMMSLIEKLISDQVETDESEKTTTTENPTQVDNSSKKPSSERTGSTAQPTGMPLSGGRLTQGFTATHNGLDFGTPLGTEIKSTMDGKVIYAGWNNQGYGNLVIVENGAYRTYYAHLSEIPVQLGESVTAGTTIGLSGSTGNSTGPHLHYEVRYQMNNIDPTSFTLNR
jgi:murein DD-endopeptidase MepM/ murein hydrolase activator NlpD